jgi:hypothetical protein
MFRTATSEVDSDLTEANALGLNSTPSFLLCCPDGKVVRLQTVKQISRFVHL